MPNKTVKTLTVDNVTYDIKDETARNALAGKQDKLTAGTNITIDETTNTISATGGADGESIKNQNIASSETKLYDWMGTLAEWTSQDVATTHPEWRCYITDDVIETHEWDDSVVHKTGTEIITGTKTFSGGVWEKVTNLAYDEVPASTTIVGWQIKDKNEVHMGAFEIVKHTDSHNQVQMNVKGKTGNWASVPLGIGQDPNGNTYTFAPTPGANSNDTNIATTKWVNDKIGDINSILDTINGEVI